MDVSSQKKNIIIIGAGIFGLCHALLLAQAGHRVRVLERSRKPFSEAASRYAGAMIAPFCEAEAAEPIIRDLGFAAAAIWRKVYPGLITQGSLVVAGTRDQGELRRFARMTSGHEMIDREGLHRLEPALADRFQTALYYAEEAHMPTPAALHDIMTLAENSGAVFEFGQAADAKPAIAAGNDAAGNDIVIDCRGLAARDELPELRGVRGERILISTPDLDLQRPVRLLHPRHACYIVPWGDGRFLLGATLIESDDTAPMTVRSALEHLGMAYALHPGFAEAELIEMSAGVRPSFPDNIPRVIVREGGRKIYANGAFRHGFLLAPLLASLTRDVIAGETSEHPLLIFA